MNKTLFLLGLLAGVAADNATVDEPEALDLEVVVEGGERRLFPLVPGTKCPAGHKCHARNVRAGVEPMLASLQNTRGGVSPLMSVLKSHLESPVTAPETWRAINADLTAAVEEDDYCSRRGAMMRAAGLAAGLGLAATSQPAFAASTTTVKMGDDTGGLKFVPAEIKVCKGDTVKWVINKAGPHNVVFDEEAVPKGVAVEDISMDGQIGEEGDSYEMSFDVAGKYEYYCEPHRSAGMNAVMIVA